MFACDSAVDPGQSHQTFACICHSPAFARLNGVLASKFSRRTFLAGAAASAGLLALGPGRSLAAVPAAPKKPVAFTNIRLFDGTSETVRTGMRVLVDGKTIKVVESDTAPLPPEVEVVDCGGRTLMPGLIDAHVHVMMAAISMQVLLTADVGYLNLLAAQEAERMLMRGFTSVRDLSGPTFGLKRAIDSGICAGPRIWPSGAMISQTSGHGDFRMPYEIPSPPGAPFSRAEAIGGSAIADGVDEVLKRCREQLMLGASQLKLAAGGGVSSNYDPLDSSQYTVAEFRAAVDAAENWGTYVTVHAYMPRAIQIAIKGGVRCIDHGQMMDEETARIMAGEGIWLSTQPFDETHGFQFAEGTPNRVKQLEMFAGTKNAYQLAREHKLKTAWGTDLLFDAKGAATQTAQLAKMTNYGFSAAEALKMATGTNAELLAMSGPRTPYPAPVGRIAQGAFADLLLVDGDPTVDLNVLADAERNLKIIMKDGVFHKNALA
ncbi:imidazolonepropionase-like amidohydrolase [Rhizobium subbaraonis]|uniref:Imidazolonepropionase-like amidohydrolase n=1 Tax=Rhizobium subbaraonis TaxID=908946 RepID=A0A285U0C0_9HYPH|nr:amidohydrolase family protein [Rhizobium subbaraonis]SOC35410.1 imidazolonepropionase-like amidohydrolase [Rhizobium subbaraonis]